ncbi:SDR family NAD(P)-dependent oxidoreductase [Nitratireductor luteus]|uniref:SDR family NAD(P)-dependent oxidoreductase n=1 Tax=Nitratireductor luteus TaxID=2976980 RepID=UPI002240A59F|nr:SDR family oxidoreductase [Nitratireductor luteus]
MKTVLVTGASRGLGRVIAETLAKDGHRVAVNCANSRSAAEDVVEAIRTAGGEADVFQFDVTEADAVMAGIAELHQRFGALDCIVNNAVGHHDVIPLEEQTWEDHLFQLEFSVKAPVLLMAEVVAGWKARGSGRIINIGSEVVNIGNAQFAHYVGAKAAMLGLTLSWASELGPFGINVNLIEPGFITVERHEEMAKDKMIADYLPHLPFNRMGKPKDIAGAVAFLASDAASFVNGQTLAVNGGRTLG